MRDAGGRLPVLVIGGYLGAGKTTLVNHLLAETRDRRLAVLVNDFGAINVDQALVARRDADAIALTNGCVCCQIGDDLTAALIRVIEADRPPDAIVIEASGVADPWRLAQVALADPALALDGVLVLVDASSARVHADDPLLADTVRRQWRAADLLVVNHADRVDGADLEALGDWLDGECPGVPRYVTVEARLPAALLDDRQWTRVPGDGSSAGENDDGPEGRAAGAGEGSGQGRRSGEQRDRIPPAAVAHGEQFETWHWRAPPRFDADRLKGLLRAMPAGVLRMKGLVRTDRHALAELQFAGRHGSLRAAPDKTPRGSATATRDPARPRPVTATMIVAIGLRGRLPVAALVTALRGALAEPPPEPPDGR